MQERVLLLGWESEREREYPSGYTFPKMGKTEEPRPLDDDEEDDDTEKAGLLLGSCVFDEAEQAWNVSSRSSNRNAKKAFFSFLPIYLFPFYRNTPNRVHLFSCAGNQGGAHSDVCW